MWPSVTCSDAMPMLTVTRWRPRIVAESVRANALQHALGDDTRHLVVRVRQQHDEFLAADARHDVAAARRARDDLDELAQHGVAAEVADGVVDRLEVIDVDGEQRDLAAATRGRAHGVAP